MVRVERSVNEMNRCMHVAFLIFNKKILGSLGSFGSFGSF